MLWITSCATSPAAPSPPTAPPPAAPAAPAAPPKPKTDERLERERVLSQLVLDSNLLDLPEPERQSIRAGAMADLAQVRFEIGMVDSAIETIDGALESAEESGNKKIRSRVVNDRYLIHRFAALDAAKSGDFAKSMRLFDKMTLAKGLSKKQQDQLGGDRLLVMEMRGDKEERARNAALQAALARMLGTAESAPVGQASPVANFEASAETLRAAIGKQMGKVTSVPEIGESELPDAEDAPVAETGFVDQRVVLEVVSANRASISSCYSQSMKGGSVIRGKLEVEVTILPTGAVGESTISSAKFAGQPVARCIADAIMRWRFPPFAGNEPRIVVLPFVLDAFF